MPETIINTEPFVLPQAGTYALPPWARAPKPWDFACKLKLQRTDFFGEQAILEPGLNYFILTMEAFGATTVFSCEGHPRGFYVVFKAPYHLARRFSRPGFFNIAITHVPGIRDRVDTDWWRLGIGVEPTSERDRRRTLRWAATAWQDEFWHGAIQPQPIDV